MTMAHIGREDILKLAKLARLKLDKKESLQLEIDLNSILGYVDLLQDVDTGNLEPTYQVTGLVNATRPDNVVNYGPSPDELLANAPELESHFIKTKRIM